MKTRKTHTLIIMLIGLLVITVNETRAQRYLPGMRGLQASVGFTDGFRISGDKKAYNAGIAYSKYTKNCNKYVLGVEYLYKSYSIGNQSVPLAQFTGEAGYYANILTDAWKILFLNIGVSAMAGYETVNWGDSYLKDGSRLLDDDGFIYGGALTAEWETCLCNRLSLLINARERILFGSDTGHFHTEIGLGLRFMID